MNKVGKGVCATRVEAESCLCNRGFARRVEEQGDAEVSRVNLTSCKVAKDRSEQA